MKIAVLGAGAMGSLFGGYLSRKNDVILVDVNKALVEKVNADGVYIREQNGETTICRPKAIEKTDGMETVELVIVFVKAMYSHSALEANRALIGPDTQLMTLQNGSGHEELLLDFVDRAHVVIGTTQHNSAIEGLGVIRHGGEGQTHIGCLEGNVNRLQIIADTFTACGLEADCCRNVRKLIWEKMFTNVSASVLTAVLQMPLGYISNSVPAWALCEKLVREAVEVAGGDGLLFDAEQKVAEVRAVCENSPEGVTSICSDLKNGRKSEVDTISGSVLRASRRNGVSAPTHEAMINLVHAMEERLCIQNKEITGG